jgi:hypothetical protein
MPTIICNTPAGLIPQELFKEEKIQEYWNVLYPNSHQENIGVDDLGDSLLLYPKPKDIETVHEMSLIYKNIRDKFPNQADAICLDLYDDSFNLLVLKDMGIAFAGFFKFSVNEDIVYHIANVSQHFFEDISIQTIYYKQIPPKVLRFLAKYFELEQM